MASTIDDLSSDIGLERSKCKLDAGCGETSSRRSAENDGLRAAGQNEARWRTNDRGASVRNRRNRRAARSVAPDNSLSGAERA